MGETILMVVFGSKYRNIQNVVPSVCIFIHSYDYSIEICNPCYGSDTFDCTGILVAAANVPPIAQDSNPGGSDVTPFLQSAKMHLTEATKNIKMGNSQAALMQINMTSQAITLVGLKLNATGYCVAP
jgi:hypothetical protein